MSLVSATTKPPKSVISGQEKTLCLHTCISSLVTFIEAGPLVHQPFLLTDLQASQCEISSLTVHEVLRSIYVYIHKGGQPTGRQYIPNRSTCPFWRHSQLPVLVRSCLLLQMKTCKVAQTHASPSCEVRRLLLVALLYATLGLPHPAHCADNCTSTYIGTLFQCNFQMRLNDGFAFDESEVTLQAACETAVTSLGGGVRIISSIDIAGVRCCDVKATDTDCSTLQTLYDESTQVSLRGHQSL